MSSELRFYFCSQRSLNKRAFALKLSYPSRPSRAFSDFSGSFRAEELEAGEASGGEGEAALGDATSSGFECRVLVFQGLGI